MKRIAISQSNYVPWKGYFDLIAAVDEFVFYDDVQYTKGDWRNRNRIQTPAGVQWLTVPVGASIGRRIADVQITDPACGARHWRRLVANYARAPHFRQIAGWLEPQYLGAPWLRLSDVNRRLVEAVCGFLGIGTRLRWSSDYAARGDRNERLVDLCRQAGADVYVSAPRARSYLDEAAFGRADIAVRWFDYAAYPAYRQLWNRPFVHEVSVLDLLFNCGRDAAGHLSGAARR